MNANLRVNTRITCYLLSLFVFVVRSSFASFLARGHHLAAAVKAHHQHDIRASIASGRHRIRQTREVRLDRNTVAIAGDGRVVW